MSAAELKAALRAELIQVAAVAVAIVEDLDYGKTGAPSSAPTLREVWRERERQDDKWGPQHHDPTVWLAILGEEFGEACQAAMRLTNQAVREKDLADDR